MLCHRVRARLLPRHWQRPARLLGLSDEQVGGALPRQPLLRDHPRHQRRYARGERTHGLPTPWLLRSCRSPSRAVGSTICAGSALIKLSRVTTAEKLYRGVGGFRLPETFLTPDEFGVRGGVEFGFLSATTDRAVAMQYASGRGSGIVYEITQGMGDRGAELTWLSQYPHEAEVNSAALAFSPKSSLSRGPLI